MWLSKCELFVWPFCAAETGELGEPRSGRLGRVIYYRREREWRYGLGLINFRFTLNLKVKGGAVLQIIYSNQLTFNWQINGDSLKLEELVIIILCKIISKGNVGVDVGLDFWHWWWCRLYNPIRIRNTDQWRSWSIRNTTDWRRRILLIQHWTGAMSFHQYDVSWYLLFVDWS